MKIDYHQNPFKTKVHLDERDRYTMLIAYQNEQYINILCELDMWLEDKFPKREKPNLQKVLERVKKWREICNLKEEDEDVQCFINAIDEEHLGDCICFACTCYRCYAESMLGIDTLDKLGKHEANKVLGAFGKDGDRTIDEAIEILEKDKEYKKPDNWPDTVGYEIHIPRWEQERKNALKWLKEYKEKHGF